MFRPGFHFSVPSNWMNDPNGLVYYEGKYHLFYQHHPYSTDWGTMHWGHAASDDLVHWEDKPIALFPDEHGTIFSGSCVVDWHNSSGFFAEGTHGLVAIFTHNDTYPGSGQPRQRQSLAYSSDKGETWSFYSGNPVLSEPTLIDFRDPKVFWHSPSSHWVMVLAAGDRIQLYRSENLRDWKLASEFGAGEGSHRGVWECPDLFELPVDDGERTKWVLIVSVGGDQDCPEGSHTQYFIGEFDGIRFVNDYSPEHVLRLDQGRDHYAGVTYSDIPDADGRRILIGWMTNLRYAGNTPTGTWRGAMTLPRVLTLVTVEGEIVLKQSPVHELMQLRNGAANWNDITVSAEVPLEVDTETELLELEIEMDISSDQELQVKVQSSQACETIIGYDPGSQRLFIDRTHSGHIDVHPDFAIKHNAPLAPKNGKIKLQLWVDRSAVEVYANDGIVVMTDLIFPISPVNRLWIGTNAGPVLLTSLKLHTLESLRDADS
ncbi:glycoside hydrolase family 32 protein [Paenibacillus brevis]|uniref:Glycoside hydrolase family 32 protein n=1 Tax=Paenibacillus brevis TaxID=2841508 RepID=A0ABS6FJI5_9BACL|nr:glycoside hydrolase family 32 protein [Paenibacillus brevis]MBU5670342.1 glycoside hydrolase family 32 protein [Paenibacillus brevis]